MKEQEPQRPKEPAPFPDRLSVADFAPHKYWKIKTLKSNPDVVVRINEFSDLQLEKDGTLSKKNAEVLQNFKDSERMYREVREKYGVPVPRMQYVIAQKEQSREPIVYTIAERIYGENLRDLFPAIKEDAEFAKELDVIYSNLLEYFIDKYQKQEPVLDDLANFQFVYGHAPNEKENKIYLVDVDQVYLLNAPEWGQGSFLRRLSKMIREAERHLRISLEDARSKLQEALDVLSEEDQAKWRDDVLRNITNP